MKAEREKSFSSFCALWKTEWKNICFPDSGSKMWNLKKWKIGKTKTAGRAGYFATRRFHALKMGRYVRPPHRASTKKGVPSVGGDALIAPPGATPEQSEKTHTPVPSTPRVDVGIGPCMEYAENGRSNIKKCFCAIAAILQKALFPLPF